MEYFLDIRQVNSIITLSNLYDFIKENNITYGVIYLYDVQEPYWPQKTEIGFKIDVDVNDIELIFTIGDYIDIPLIEKAFGKFKKITVHTYPNYWLARSLFQLYQVQHINKNHN